MKPPIIECAHCGQPSYVSKVDGIHCACTPGRSAEENLLIAAGNPPEVPMWLVREVARRGAA